jgi:MSHA biogenesis protein MshP
MSATCRKREGGFSIVSAIFIIVVLAVLAVALVTVASMQHASSGLDLQGVRAYQAARAGADWGVYRIVNPDAVADPPVALPANDVPSCWSPAAAVPLSGGLAPFSVSVSCTRTRTTELDRIIGVYNIVSTATFGAAQQPSYVSREVQVTVSRCKNPANPGFEC